jgi:hypothetical protein
VVLLMLGMLSAGCASGQRAGTAGQTASHGATPGMGARPGAMRMLASAYLAAARPANHRLDGEVDGFTDHEHGDLAAAGADLRAEAATERRFDRVLRVIPFPRGIAATARALIRANQRRAALAGRQARSSLVAVLVSFTSRRRAADAAVEAQVRIIRRELGLPPPQAG